MSGSSHVSGPGAGRRRRPIPPAAPRRHPLLGRDRFFASASPDPSLVTRWTAHVDRWLRPLRGRARRSNGGVCLVAGWARPGRAVPGQRPRRAAAARRPARRRRHRAAALYPCGTKGRSHRGADHPRGPRPRRRRPRHRHVVARGTDPGGRPAAGRRAGHRRDRGLGEAGPAVAPPAGRLGRRPGTARPRRWPSTSSPTSSPAGAGWRRRARPALGRGGPAGAARRRPGHAAALRLLAARRAAPPDRSLLRRPTPRSRTGGRRAGTDADALHGRPRRGRPLDRMRRRTRPGTEPVVARRPGWAFTRTDCRGDGGRSAIARCTCSRTPIRPRTRRSSCAPAEAATRHADRPRPLDLLAERAVEMPIRGRPAPSMRSSSCCRPGRRPSG